MTNEQGAFDYQSVVLETCKRLNVPFDRRSPGTLLIARSGVEAVLNDVIARGYRVLGFEGFEREGTTLRPRIDLIYDSERWPNGGVDALARFGDEIWVDIVLGRPRGIGQL